MPCIYGVKLTHQHSSPKGEGADHAARGMDENGTAGLRAASFSGCWPGSLNLPSEHDLVEVALSESGRRVLLDLAQPLLALRKNLWAERGEILFPVIEDPGNFSEAYSPGMIRAHSLYRPDRLSTTVELGKDVTPLCELLEETYAAYSIRARWSTDSLQFEDGHGRELDLDDASQTLMAYFNARSVPERLRLADGFSPALETKTAEGHQGVVVPTSPRPLIKLLDLLKGLAGLRLREAQGGMVFDLTSLCMAEEQESSLTAAVGTTRALKFATISHRLSPIEPGWHSLDLQRLLQGVNFPERSISRLAADIAMEHGWSPGEHRIQLDGISARLSAGVSHDSGVEGISHYRIGERIFIQTQSAHKPLWLHLTLHPAGGQPLIADFSEAAALLSLRDRLAQVTRRNLCQGN